MIICFDMDGTIADLYSVPNWLQRLRAEDSSPYLEAKPLVDMTRLREVLLALSAQGEEIRVISWLAKNSSKEYKAAIRKAKRAWLEKYNFPADRVHLIQYGATKASCIGRIECTAILIDDSAKIRNGWHLGRTIDPMTENILKKLEELIK